MAYHNNMSNHRINVFNRIISFKQLNFCIELNNFVLKTYEYNIMHVSTKYRIIDHII